MDITAAVHAYLQTSSLYTFCLSEVRGYGRHCLCSTDNSPCMRSCQCVLPVRHPPPSGWLDEPGRLKGGGVPSPYSNSLKPPIIVTGILVTDIRFDLFQLKANRRDRIATRPKVLAREIAIMAPKLAGDGNRTFALEKPNDRCHGMLGRDLDAHMHMIWHHMSLDDAAFLLAGQLMKDWPKLTTNLPKQLLPATFGHKHNMVLAIPARMRQALIER